jgi:hypothetical protein
MSHDFISHDLIKSCQWCKHCYVVHTNVRNDGKFGGWLPKDRYALKDWDSATAVPHRLAPKM